MDMNNLTDNQRAFLADWVAYYKLDHMPGMQMNVDADLNCGTISEDQAKERRDLIQYFYQVADEIYNRYNLGEFGAKISRAEDREEGNKDKVSSIIYRIVMQERTFLAERGFDEYNSLDEVQEEDLECLDIDDRKMYSDLAEYKSAAFKVKEIIDAKNTSSDKKELHRIKKDLEMAIRDLRAIKGKKNKEVSFASSISSSLEELISVCRDSGIAVINAENRNTTM